MFVLKCHQRRLVRKCMNLRLSYGQYSALEIIFGAENLLFPTFNYDFAKLKVLDVNNSESHVGVLTFSPGGSSG